jgi:cytoskeletal protein RodZ
MIESIGKKLCQARLARGLSLEDAAHATRARPEKLIALENDDYGRFGSNAYAKGFLQIYGRYHNVDVSEHVRALEIPRQVTISDYQYLNNAPEPETSRIQIQRYNQRPSVLPVLMMLGLIIIGAIFLAGYMFSVTMERLEPKTANQQSTMPQASTTQAAAVVKTGSQAESGPAPRITEPTLTPIGESQPGLQLQPEGATIPVVNPSPADASPDILPAVAAAQVANEIIVEPLKKTWVKIRRDSATAIPVFEDYLYPGAQPLKLRGEKFYVEVREQDAVQIRKNGSPIAYQSPGISIQ